MHSPPGLNCWLTDRQGDYVAERKPSFVSPPKYGAIQKRVCRGQSTVPGGSAFVPSQALPPNGSSGVAQRGRCARIFGGNGQGPVSQAPHKTSG